MVNAFERDIRKLTRIERIRERGGEVHLRWLESRDVRKWKRAKRLLALADRLMAVRNARFAANGYRNSRP